MSVFACGIVSVLILFTLNRPHTSAFLELWMIYFNGVNERRRKELAEKLVKPFTHHRTLCRRACLWFYHFHACRCGLGLETSMLYLLYTRRHLNAVSTCVFIDISMHVHATQQEKKYVLLQKHGQFIQTVESTHHSSQWPTTPQVCWTDPLQITNLAPVYC